MFNRFFPRIRKQNPDEESQSELLIEVMGSSKENDRIILLTDILDADVKLGPDDLLEIALQMFDLMMFVHSIELFPSFSLENFGLVVSEQRVVLLNWLDVSMCLEVLDETAPMKQVCEVAHNLLLLSRAELRMGRWEVENLNSELELTIIETLLAGTQGIFTTATEFYLHLRRVKTLLDEETRMS